MLRLVNRMRRVDNQSPVPKYYQLGQIIREMIENEELQPGDAIPTEMELCKYHGVSRMTARKAIQNLVHEGLLYREQGKGTFVAYPKERRNVSQLLSFTEEMKAKGKKVTNKIMLFEKNKPSKKIAKILDINPDEDFIFMIKRLRIVSGLPFAIELAHIPEKIVPGLKLEDIEKNSLYDLIENTHGNKLSYGKQSVEPVVLTAYEKEMFEIQDNSLESSLGLLFERTTYSEDGEAIEYTRSVYRADIYKLEYTLQRVL